MALPEIITDWFAQRGWSPRRHQLEMLDQADAGRHALLVASTGAGKTLAGFLPSLVALGGEKRPRSGARVRRAGLFMFIRDSEEQTMPAQRYDYIPSFPELTRSAWLHTSWRSEECPV